jgi:8-oxo-dGTP pyrophosphatase MutT (NUDIX family)
MSWNPHVTVAAIVERAGKFLMIEERTNGRLVLNQPAGHLEPGESLLQAVARETLEEAGYRFEPEAFIGVYHFHNDRLDRTVIRFALCGSVDDYVVAPSDPSIVATHWLDPSALRQRQQDLRCPEVLTAIEDYLDGRRLPLDALSTSPLPSPETLEIS